MNFIVPLVSELTTDQSRYIHVVMCQVSPGSFNKCRKFTCQFIRALKPDITVCEPIFRKLTTADEFYRLYQISPRSVKINEK